jgi:hypothetical protein
VTLVRAVAFGVPERVHATLDAVGGITVTNTLMDAAKALDDNPHAAVIYGEHAFGDAVTGQPIMLVDEQGDPMARWLSRVMVAIDCSPNATANLDWDDPRRLAFQAAVALKAAALVDLADPDVVAGLDRKLAAWVDTPREGGHTEVNGNDEPPNGDPNDHE